jgi:hypothetical protein
MAISIKDYSNWAQANIGTEVAVSQWSNRLEKASDQVGFFAQFFNLSSAKAVRTKAMADFTRALSAHFGATIAQQALDKCHLAPSSKLEGRTIAAVIAKARDIRDTNQAAVCDDLKLVPQETVRDTVTRYAGQADAQKYITRHMRQRTIAIELLGEAPLDANDFEDFYARVIHTQRKLASLSSLPGASRVDQQFRDDAAALNQALEDKLQQMETMLEGCPRSEASEQVFKDVWRATVLRALNGLLAKAQKPVMQFKLSAMIQYISTNGPAFDAKIPLAEDTHELLASVLLDDIKSQVGWRNREFDKDQIAKELAACYRKVLNERPWPVIDKTFDAAIGSRAIKLQSVIVPGKQIAAQGGNPGPIGATYEQGVNGYMCHTADTPHAVNLAVSSLSVLDATGASHLAFRGIRHGVHCAWEISHPTIRAQVNLQRAREAVIAAYLAAHPQPPGGPVQVAMNLVSVSLLSPDAIRHLVGGSGDERQMLREQTDAWAEVQRQGVSFTYGNQTIQIQPNILTFNFGVNAGALKDPTGVLGGWSVSRPMNATARTALTAAYRQFVNDPNVPQTTRNYARDLFTQCTDVLDAGGERWDSHDAYKVAARLAVLTHLMGWTPCWNCKSGKDRTGQMDVECKFLSTLIAQGLPIPTPGAALTKEQQGLFRAIAFEGGNFEVQQLNTGIGGYKTSGIKSIIARLGGKIYRAFHKGRSDIVNV